VDEHCHGGALLQITTFHASWSEWFCAVFWCSQYTSDILVVPYLMKTNSSTNFLSQKTAANSFLAYNICLNILGLFGVCVSQMEPKSHHLSLIRSGREIHCHIFGITVKVKAEGRYFPCCGCTCGRFQNRCYLKPVAAWPKCEKLIQNTVWLVEIHIKVLKLWTTVFPNILVNTLNKIITHYRCPFTLLFILSICLPTYLWAFYTTA
jgi:hypothetical protein